MITARHYFFRDEKGIAQASIRIADNPSGPNKISVFGAAKYLPIPLGDGCGQMVDCEVCGDILKTNEEECTGVCFDCSLPDDE